MLSLLAGHTHSNRSRGGVCNRDSTSSIEIDLRAEEKQREEEEPGEEKKEEAVGISDSDAGDI